MLNRRPNQASRASQKGNSNENPVRNQNTTFESMMNSNKQTLHDTDVKIYGFRRNILKTVFYHAFSIMTVGLLFLIGKFWPMFELKLVYLKCPLKDAAIILVKDANGSETVCKVHEVSVEISSDDTVHKEVSSEEMLKILQVVEQTPATPSTSFSSTESSEGSSDNELLKTAVKINSRRGTFGRIMNSVMHGDQDSEAKELVSLPSDNNTSSTIRYFEYHHEKFVLDEALNSFHSLNGLENVTCQQILDMKGNSRTQEHQLARLYGSNNISIVVKHYFQLFIEEATNPFYLFQVASIGIWSLDEYYLYAICVCIIVFGTIIASILETKQQMTMLKEMAEGKGELLVTVERPNGGVEDIMASELVPGDIILIPTEGFTTPCDAVVTHGTCIVNESMLTGESIPVNKAALIPSDEEYDTETFKRNTLFCGTQVIQTRFYAGTKAKCVVVRTGFSTAKGSLIRSIIYPKHVSFSFRNDARKFVGILFGIAFVSMIYTSFQYLHRHASIFVTSIRVLDTLTIAVPPALPAALSIGSYYAQIRLKIKNIFCTSPDRINFAGKIKLLCFDKTGTLTEGGLDLWCVVPHNPRRQAFERPMRNPEELPIHSHLLRGMATCHSITYIHGDLIGDPLDLKMFESTKWELEEPFMYQNEAHQYDVLVPTVVKKDSFEIGILRQFEFTPQLQRMSVVVRAIDTPRQMELYCKGSPEKVLPLCIDVPTNYEKILDAFTVKGYRVLALAAKTIVGLPWHQLQRISRTEVETDLSFCGFIVMQNCLKLATKSVINKLTKGGIRSVMVTGDNMLTAVSVARECNMIGLSDKTIAVDVNGRNELEFRLTASQQGESSLIADFQQASNSGSDQEEAHITIQMGEESEDHDFDDREEENETYNKMGQNSEFTALDEAVFMQRCRSDSISGKKLEACVTMTRNSSPVSMSEATFIDMNNHLIQVPSTAAIIPSEDLPFTRSEMKHANRLIATAAGVLHDLANANYHFVMTGRAWTHIYQSCSKDVLNKILVKGTVFARMNPENKRQLVEAFQGIGYCVGMCGDGANDCAALKMAHVGISLSDAEASVAAPFTSKVCDISCVETLVLEGRCALVTSFSMFKYMALYSMVQLCTVLILYSKGTNLADPQFLFIDLGIITTLAIAMGRTHPSTKLVNQRPMAKLLSVQNFVSIIFQIVLAASCQVVGLLYLQSQSWFVPVKLDNPDEKIDQCWETTTLFHVSCFQYIVLSLAFSKGKPFRKPFYTNWLLIGFYVVCFVLSLLLILLPVPSVQNLFHLMPWKLDETLVFRFQLLAIPLVNLVVSLSFERLVDNRNYLRKILHKLGWTKKKFEYEEVQGQLESDLSWPPIKIERDDGD